MSAAEQLSGPVIRPYRESDKDFIEASWLDSYFDGFIRLAFPSIEKLTYFQGQRRLIRNLFSRPGIKVVVACSPEYDEAILSWLIAEGNFIHYAFTKGAFKRLGIASSLVDAAGVDRSKMSYSHVTKMARALLAGKATYDPWRGFIDDSSTAAAFGKVGL